MPVLEGQAGLLVKGPSHFQRGIVWDSGQCKAQYLYSLEILTYSFSILRTRDWNSRGGGRRTFSNKNFLKWLGKKNQFWTDRWGINPKYFSTWQELGYLKGKMGCMIVCVNSIYDEGTGRHFPTFHSSGGNAVLWYFQSQTNILGGGATFPWAFGRNCALPLLPVMSDENTGSWARGKNSMKKFEPFLAVFGKGCIQSLWVWWGVVGLSEKLIG